MKITIIETFPSLRGVELKKHIECKGSGTKEDPAILEPSPRIPRKFHIHSNRLYIIIKNLNSRNIFFKNCRNISIENSTFTSLDFDVCSDFVLKNSTVYKYIKLFKCQKIEIEDCYIGKLLLLHSSHNIIRNTTIYLSKERASEANIIEGSNIQKTKSNIPLLGFYYENSGFVALLVAFVLFGGVLFIFTLVYMKQITLIIISLIVFFSILLILIILMGVKDIITHQFYKKKMKNRKLNDT